MEDILKFARSRLNDEHFDRFLYAFNSGKRIRPKMMERVCGFLGKDFAPLVPAAAAIEIMHCFSLVHDDIIDGSEKRRGRESFYKKFGTNSAVLFGDLFAIVATEILAEEYSREIYLEFIRAIKNMVEGQIMELEGSVTDIDSYFSYVDKKTSSLFALAAKIPLMYYGMKDDVLVDSAKKFGTAFQMMNDMNGKKEIGVLDFMSRDEADKILAENMHGLHPKMAETLKLLI